MRIIKPKTRIEFEDKEIIILKKLLGKQSGDSYEKLGFEANEIDLLDSIFENLNNNIN